MMKKLLISFLLFAAVLLLASCDTSNIQNKVEEMSESLKDGIIDAMGNFIEKDTSPALTGDGVLDNDTDSTPSDIPSDIVSDTQGDVTSDVPSDSDSGSTPDIPDEPTVPEIPEYIVLEREKYPLNKYTGLDIFRTGNSFKDGEYKFRTAYGYGRYETTLDELMGSNPLSYFKINNMESSVHIDFDLSKARYEISEETDDEISFSEITAKIHEFAKKYCVNSLISNLTRIEIGSNPDASISAKDYALLLNLIYDNNCKQNGYDVPNEGTTFINPYIRLITGKMSSINLTYVKELMSELEALRDDDFLPIGGWSFSINTEGKAPEEVFLENEALKELIAYRNENYSSIEIYLNDFGWDTVNTESSLYVAPTDTYTSEELQAAYFLRSFLILQGMDVDKASYDLLNDTDEYGHGIVNKDGSKKLSFTLLEYFKSKMNGTYFIEAVSNGENGVYCYKFENQNGKTVYTLWSTEDTEYTLTFETDAQIMVSEYDKTDLYVDTLCLMDGGINLNLNGIVTFVEYEEATEIN